MQQRRDDSQKRSSNLMTNELTTIEQRNVSFYEDSVIAIRASDGGVYVPIRPICDLIGIAFNAQGERISRDPILSQEAQYVRVTRMNSQRGNPNMLALPLDVLNGWLFGISANRIKKPDVRERVLQYQRECYRVLHNAFNGGLQPIDSVIDEVAHIDPEAAEALAIAEAVVKLARSHVRVLRQVSDHETRLQLLEARGGDASRHIDNAQASAISQAVKTIALELGKRSGRNEFGGVYGELYRRYEIAAYRELPNAQYEDALKFLSDWYSSLTGNQLPF